MTFKEKLMKEHPKYVGSQYKGGCKGCPHNYGYEERFKTIKYCSNFKCEECWNREIPESEVKNMRFKVGDKVVVREWDEMVKKFGLDYEGDININKNIVFARDMKDSCGQILTIVFVDIYNNEYKVSENFHDYSDEMLMPFEFSESDMNNGNMLKVRNGEIYMWLNGNPTQLADGFLSQTNDDLKNKAEKQYDVMEVRDSKGYEGTISDLFDDYESLPFRWVRKEEPTVKEFSIDEINKILKEKFPDVDKFKINTKE